MCPFACLCVSVCLCYEVNIWLLISILRKKKMKLSGTSWFIIYCDWQMDCTALTTRVSVCVFVSAFRNSCTESSTISAASKWVRESECELTNSSRCHGSRACNQIEIRALQGLSDEIFLLCTSAQFKIWTILCFLHCVVRVQTEYKTMYIGNVCILIIPFDACNHRPQKQNNDIWLQTQRWKD